jgi:hypothetical protein
MDRTHIFRSCCAAVVCTLAVRPLVAQQRSIVQGTVIDSVRGGVLAGAYVELVPGGRQVPTNVRGFFRFDNVAAGESYELRVMHALLDTLGVALTTPRFVVAAADMTTIDVSVPSPARIVEMLCGRAALLRGPAALTGVIRDPDTGAPLDSVNVSLVYDDSPMPSIARSVNRRSATPDASGRFMFCGLPLRMTGHVQLTRKGVTSADIPVSLNGESPLALRSLGMSRSTRRVVIGKDSAGRSLEALGGDGTLAGRVTNKAGEPLGGAMVQLDGTAGAALTAEDGRFTLSGLPTGTQIVRARKVGYSPKEQVVEVGPDGSPPTIVMAGLIPSMPTVVTRSDRTTDLMSTGFARRKAQGVGFFLEGEQIDRGPPTLGEALRMVPGLRIGYDAQNQRQQKTLIMNSRDTRGCIRYVVDGVIFSEIGGDIEKFVRPSEIEALEMYNPASVPGEFAAASRGRCSVLVLWTNHMIRPAKKK